MLLRLNGRGDLLISWADLVTQVWDLTEGTCLMTLDGHQDAVTCLNLTHDGMKIITGSLDYSLKFWDLSTGKVRHPQLLLGFISVVLRSVFLLRSSVVSPGR